MLHSGSLLASSGDQKKSFGGKANGLLHLIRSGFNVPDFFVLDHQQIGASKSDSKILKKLLGEWIVQNNIDPQSAWAVRSSAEIEDGTQQSFAGLFTTEINVLVPGLESAITKVIKGFSSADSGNYYTGPAFECNIIIQKMIASEISGVGFSRNPNDGNDHSAVINIIPGLGFKLVSGEENAMTILCDEKKTVLQTEENVFKGQGFKSGYYDIEINKDKLFEKIIPHVKILYKGLKKLEQEKGYAVDVEFTIYNDKIYWLQVRPVTAIYGGVSGYQVWDNSNMENNYPGVTLPLSSSFVSHSYGNAYIAMCRFLGGGDAFIKCNIELFQNMIGTINGALYYHVTAWQQLLYQMPFGKKTSALITKMWGAEEATFIPSKYKAGPLIYARLFFNLMSSLLFFSIHKKKYLKKYKEAISYFTPQLLSGKPQAELVIELKKLEKDLGDKWFVPMLNGFFTMIFFNGLRKILSVSRLKNEYPNFVNDILLNSGDVISVAIVQDLRVLVNSIRSDTAAKQLLLAEEPEMILKNLKSDYPRIYEKFSSYVDKYGERCDEGELKMETVNYKEDPLKLILLLKTSLINPPQINETKSAFRYKIILKKYYKLNFIKRWILTMLIKITIKRVRDRENFRFIRTKTFGIVRALFKNIEKDLLKNGYINCEGDLLYLNYKEVTDVSQNNNYKNIIEERKTEYNKYKTETRATRYLQTDKGFIPVAAKINTSGALKGLGCSSGIVEAEVLEINPENIHESPVAGKILIARYFEPGWISLFANAAGLITERGSLLSHTAILCREMGTPTIIGVRGLMNVLKTGDKIKMDGGTGVLEVLATNK